MLNEVVLRFAKRDYKDEESKWRVGSKGLSILLVLLQHYTPSQDDFEQKYFSYNDKQIPLSKPPGFELMSKILAEDGAELRYNLISTARAGLAGLNEGVDSELIVRRAFEIIELVLEKQKAFLAYNSNASHPNLSRGLDSHFMQKRYAFFFFSKTYLLS